MNLDEVASGLLFPEGPIALADGSLLVVEIAGGTLTRIEGDGRVERLAHLGGGPNGAAIGPGGKCFVCNNGGMVFSDMGGGRLVPTGVPKDYGGGWIEAVDLETGTSERLYEACDGLKLNGPNDIVFDAEGGFWFTDMGKTNYRDRKRDLGAVYYGRADGSSIERKLFPLDGPNGIGLSRDGRTLYVAESVTGRLWSFKVEGPGQLANYSSLPPWDRGTMLWASPRYVMLDSLAVDLAGNIYVADIPYGGITVITPEGELLEQIAVPDDLTTNICFGGRELRDMFITASSTGKLFRRKSERQGLPLHWAI